MNIPPPPQIERDGLGAPINKDQIGDDLDFEKEILDTANQSMMRGDMFGMDPSNMQDGSMMSPVEPIAKQPPPPPPKPQLSFAE